MLNHKQISWWSKFSPQKKLNIIHGSAASILIGGFFGVLAVISQPQGDDKKEKFKKSAGTHVRTSSKRVSKTSLIVTTPITSPFGF
jgi:hypothetical protein